LAANHYTLPSPIAESTISFLLYLRCIEDELGRSLTTPEKNRAVDCFLANCEVSEAALFITALIAAKGRGVVSETGRCGPMRAPAPPAGRVWGHQAKRSISTLAKEQQCTPI